MKLFRLFLLAGIAFFAVSWFSGSALWKKTEAIHLSKKAFSYPVSNRIEKKLEEKAFAAKHFIRQKKFNDNVCFLLDMSLPSGQNRYFIYDLKKDSLIHAGLVAHGNCFQYWLEGRQYSNVVGSGCTSLGKYKIGNHYTRKFGYSYKLYGLDSANSNAFERTVVLHSHSCVPDSEINEEICQSNGCPTVLPTFLEKLKAIINNSGKPILLWIYE